MENENVKDDKEIYTPLTVSESVYNACEVEKQIVAKNMTRRKLVVKLILTTVLVTATVSSGMTMGYSAVLLPQLKATNGSLHTDEEMGSWIASIPTTATPIGAILGGILMDYFGRKLTLQIQTGVVAAGWLCISVCHNHGLLLTGRFIGGFASGIGISAIQIYIGEVTDPKMRSAFSVIPMVSSSFGILLVYILGSTIHWRLIAGLGIIPPVMSAFMYFILPESPVWLVRNGHIEKARQASLWYRGNDVNQAAQEIQQLIDRTENQKPQKTQNSQLYGVSWCLPQVIKPLVIVNTFNIFQTLSGWFLVVLYAVEIISLIVEENLNEFFAAVLTAGVRLIFTLVAVFILASVGRRTYGIYSTLCTGLFAVSLGLCLYLNFGKNSYFLAACLLLYVAAATIGFATLPGIMVGELFPARARAMMASVTVVVGSLMMFGFAKLFPLLKKLVDIHGLFLLFGISSFLGSILIYFALPETRNKTLNEIEDYFRQDNMLWTTRNKKCNSLSKPSAADPTGNN